MPLIPLGLIGLAAIGGGIGGVAISGGLDDTRRIVKWVAIAGGVYVAGKAARVW